MALYNYAYTDALLPYQWNLHRMSVLPAWRHTRGAGIKLAVIDDGLSFDARTKPEYAGKNIDHWNSWYQSDVFYDAGDELMEYPQPATISRSNPATYQHGLATSGLAVAQGTNDGVGMVGVAPEADYVNMAAWCMDDSAGAFRAAAQQRGFTKSAELFGAKVVSMSATGLKPIGDAMYPGWDTVFQYMQSRALIFMAAGNDGAGQMETGNVGQPARGSTLYGGFAVGGTTYEELDRPINYSNWGPYVHVVTPGHRVWTPHWITVQSPLVRNASGASWQSVFPTSAWASGNESIVEDYRQFTGTSAACPLAAGVAALVWSANPSMSADTMRAVYLECMDRPTHWLFLQRYPNAGIPNALKGVLRAKALATPGSLFPFVGFQGPGVSTAVAAGVATTHLRGPLRIEVDGFSTSQITRVQLFAGAKLVYDGPPRRVKRVSNTDPAAGWTGAALEVNASYLTDGNIRVVAYTATDSAEETYTDIVAHSISGAVAPPKTSASVPAGPINPGTQITLSAESDAHPVRISYRWGAGPWQRYTGPIAAQGATLQFYGVDCLGNVEGGTDYDPD